MDNLTAPEWITSQWLNSDEPLTLSAMRGSVILAGAFLTSLHNPSSSAKADDPA